jgi:hypothetical protein
LPPIFYGQPEDERLDVALGPDSHRDGTLAKLPTRSTGRFGGPTISTIAKSTHFHEAQDLFQRKVTTQRDLDTMQSNYLAQQSATMVTG